LRKEDGRIDFSQSAPEIYNRLRGFQPWPGAYTNFRGRQLLICSARVVEHSAVRIPGTLLVDNNQLLACCRASVLELLEVQPEGKKRMVARDFINGYRPQTGEELGVA